jgi:predicted extracellular nuclease
LSILFLASASSVEAAANHVVISEFATRGPTSATEEFIELYNPTSNAIDISGWKLQYKPAALSSFSDRATLPAATTIGAHKFYLIMNNSYASPPVTPDFTSSSWGSSTGMADNGHMRIVTRLRRGRQGRLGQRRRPERRPSPNHGTTANSNSVERKAFANSTADSLARTAHWLLGNGQDTNVNGSDFVVGRSPSTEQRESARAAFAVGGSGTGLATVQPSPVDANATVDFLQFSFSRIRVHHLPDCVWCRHRGAGRIKPRRSRSPARRSQAQRFRGRGPCSWTTRR